MIVKNLDIKQYTSGVTELVVTLTNLVDLRILEELKEVDLLDLTLKKHRKKRTLTQNAYLWILCDMIAKKISSTKVEVYRIAIRRVGVYIDKEINTEDVSFFVKAWRARGIGFVCDKMIDTSNNKITTVRFHEGSSKYSTEDMARLIDEIVTSAKDLGIDIMPIESIKRLERKI